MGRAKRNPSSRRISGIAMTGYRRNFIAEDWAGDVATMSGDFGERSYRADMMGFAALPSRPLRS
jgi:hypothetical protein